jgi:hypothetical protein
MTGGIGFSRQGEASHKQNRDLLKKKKPFQRIRENKFLKPIHLQFKVSKKLLRELATIKSDKAMSGRWIRVGLTLAIIVILSFYLLFLFK